MSPEDRAALCRRIGALGGKATVRKHGKRHMKKIAKRGLAAQVAKYWDGDRDRALARLAELGRQAADPAPYNGAWQYPRKEGEPW